MSVSISRKNAKMGGIPSISFPPVKTCRHCEKCAKKCYALKMARFRPSIGAAWENNLKEWNEHPDAVKYAILSEAITSGYFRYFVGGDIPDVNFLSMMAEIAEIVPRCEFLAFTKQYDIVNAYINGGHELPKNLHIIFSKWGEDVPNPHNLPCSDVIFKGEKEPERAKICGGNCIDCICKGIACWELQNGETIYFHEH